jgi:uncharacterized protein (TIGR03382 family)
MHARTIALLGLAALLESASPAHACTIAPLEDHQLDTAHNTDTVAPSAVTASAIVERQDSGGGCAGAQSKCGGGAWITIAVTASDNAATVDKLGYQLRIVSGEAPDGLVIPSTAVTPVGGQLHFYFNAEDRAGFALDLELRARDLNGNLGPPTVIKVGEPGESGCSTGGSGALGGVLLALAALLARRHRR